ncbi:MAG: peptidase [Hyphobacterium sp.]|nr:MAG: peptidase [Hyphobacterium sp.]
MGDAKTGGLIAAFRFPDARAWTEAAILFMIFAGLAALIGIGSGLFEDSPHFDTSLLVTAVVAVFIPAMGEELVFRVWLLPWPAGLAIPPSRPTTSAPQDEVEGKFSNPPHAEVRAKASLEARLLFILPSLALFVLWHPVQVWLGLPLAQAVFLDWRFLITAALLGIACTISWQRSGSIWPAIAIHWAAVVGWKALLA